MYGIHTVLTTVGMNSGSGAAWVMSIVGLTIVIRILIIPLFNKQIRAMRMGQEIQPEVQKLQKKYKGRTDAVSKQRQQEELMALYRERGTSPFASCLPLLIQMPIFFALFRLLNNVNSVSKGAEGIGAVDQRVATEIANSTLFGAPLSSSLGTAGSFNLTLNVQVVTVVLIVLMMATLFFSQKMIMTKNLPESAQDPDNPAYKMQKMMLYGMPLIYVFSGFAFQVGVLVYWLTSNLWNIGQQYWLITYNPTPGSPAYKKRQQKLRAKRIAAGLPPEEEPEEPVQPRVQPLGKERSKKAAKKKHVEPTTSASENNSEEVRGLDGLTDAERAQKRYERRMAQRQRANEKKQARQKKANRNKKNRNF